MFSLPLPLGQRSRSEGEKPFWISYSDLMTALMVLFLVVMSVSLLTITQELLEQNRILQEQKAQLEAQQRELALAKKLMDALKARRDVRQQAINDVMDRLQAAAHNEVFRGRVSIGRERLTVDFGEAARFNRSDYRLTPEGTELLRAFIPALLEAVDSEAGRQWFKRIVVEGFTDTDGSYLYNLDLSLKRAQSVVCALIATSPATGTSLTPEQQRRVRDLFLVGGFSFNSAKASKEESRRVELRLDFQAVDEEPEKVIGLGPVEIGKCQLN